MTQATNTGAVIYDDLEELYRDIQEIDYSFRKILLHPRDDSLRIEHRIEVYPNNSEKPPLTLLIAKDSRGYRILPSSLTALNGSRKFYFDEFIDEIAFLRGVREKKENWRELIKL